MAGDRQQRLAAAHGRRASAEHGALRLDSCQAAAAIEDGKPGAVGGKRQGDGRRLVGIDASYRGLDGGLGVVVEHESFAAVLKRHPEAAESWCVRLHSVARDSRPPEKLQVERSVPRQRLGCGLHRIGAEEHRARSQSPAGEHRVTAGVRRQHFGIGDPDIDAGSCFTASQTANCRGELRRLAGVPSDVWVAFADALDARQLRQSLLAGQLPLRVVAQVAGDVERTAPLDELLQQLHDFVRRAVRHWVEQCTDAVGELVELVLAEETEVDLAAHQQLFRAVEGVGRWNARPAQAVVLRHDEQDLRRLIPRAQPAEGEGKGAHHRRCRARDSVCVDQPAREDTLHRVAPVPRRQRSGAQPEGVMH